MNSATLSLSKTVALSDSCRLSLPSLFTTKTPYPFLSIPSKPPKLHFACSSSSLLSNKKKPQFSSLVTFVAQTSDWAQQEGDNATATIDELSADETEARVSDWEGEDASVESDGGEEAGVFKEREEEESFVEPPEEAKLFVGNLSFNVDSQNLAMLFEKAGVVEICEVIYNRETDQSRGFGFVTMSTVEEAENAVKMFNQYNLEGRLLTVNKASPRGSRPERAPRAFEPAFRIYVGNLPWDFDNARLHEIFSEHGKVVDARVVFDRETGRSRGFGFVTMASEAEMNDAIAALDGQSVLGRSIRVNVAEERPRRSF
ncbi:hypothetical protein CsatB_017725 [Cannabis sativa]|uniref:RRM domain-containing protein n=1 Tax=Cannabis sativa TaxID=3483 RepID=A0A7J6FZ68_CANSA|nr:hypothetical protein F8388_004972 [Cannabis sativa]